jgi:hypothetical protein
MSGNEQESVVRAIAGLEDIARGGVGLASGGERVPRGSVRSYPRGPLWEDAVGKPQSGEPDFYVIRDRSRGPRPSHLRSYCFDWRGEISPEATEDLAEAPLASEGSPEGSEELARISRGETDALRSLSKGRGEFWNRFNTMLETLPELSEEERAELLSRPRPSGRD